MVVGVGEASGAVRRGDLVLAVNGVNVTSMSSPADITHLLKGFHNRLAVAYLRLARFPPDCHPPWSSLSPPPSKLYFPVESLAAEPASSTASATSVVPAPSGTKAGDMPPRTTHLGEAALTEDTKERKSGATVDRSQLDWTSVELGPGKGDLVVVSRQRAVDSTTLMKLGQLSWQRWRSPSGPSCWSA